MKNKLVYNASFFDDDYDMDNLIDHLLKCSYGFGIKELLRLVNY
jgi:hypothetical protein